MKTKDYAFIKSGTVVNVVVFEDPVDQQLLEHFKNEFLLNAIIPATEKSFVSGTYDGNQFWLPQPYSSWVKNNGEWVAPKPFPNDGNFYRWNEDAVDWVLTNP